MNKYKININKSMPSDEVIHAKKNFNELLTSFEEVHKPHLLAKNRHKKRTTIQLIVVIVAVLLALFVTHQKTETEEKTTTEIKK